MIEGRREVNSFRNVKLDMTDLLLVENTNVIFIFRSYAAYGKHK